jgi:hypothetical protein
MATTDETTGPTGLTALLRRIATAPPAFYATAVGASALANVPLTDRAALLRDQLAHLPHGTRRFPNAGNPIRVGKTGSGPDLLLLSWTAADLQREIEAGVRVFGRLGISAGMRVANALAGALVTPGALLLGDVVEAIGALDVPLGAIDGPAAAKGAWELLDRVEPALLILDQASAGPLFAGMPAGVRPWWRGIVWLRTDAAPAAARPAAPAGFSGWERTWLAIPDAASFVGHEVAPGRYLLDEGVCGEVVDDRLVVTPLGREMVLLRYPTGLRARLVDGAGGVVELT